jgi:hypothetical protein
MMIEVRAGKHLGGEVLQFRQGVGNRACTAAHLAKEFLHLFFVHRTTPDILYR